MINRVLPSIAIQNINLEKCYFNPGCAASIYKPELPELMLELLRGRFGSCLLYTSVVDLVSRLGQNAFGLDDAVNAVLIAFQFHNVVPPFLFL